MTRPIIGCRGFFSVIAPLVAVLMTLVIGLDGFGMPLGGRWHEDDGALCPVGADWTIPIDQMRFATPENGQTTIGNTRPGCIPDDGGQCHFVPCGGAGVIRHAPAVATAQASQPALGVAAFRLLSRLRTVEPPTYCSHGPPRLPPRAVPRLAPPRAPPICS